MVDAIGLCRLINAGRCNIPASNVGSVCSCHATFRHRVSAAFSRATQHSGIECRKRSPVPRNIPASVSEGFPRATQHSLISSIGQGLVLTSNCQHETRPCALSNLDRHSSNCPDLNAPKARFQVRVMGLYHACFLAYVGVAI